MWTTHRIINEAVAYYEQQLTLMRGREYLDEKGATVPREVVRAAALSMARDAQRRNIGRLVGQDEEVLALLSRLYEFIVPSTIGEKGFARKASDFLGPLTDPTSRGFLAAFEKLERPRPAWLQGLVVDPSGTFAAAQAWLDTPEAEPWVLDTGRPPKWLCMARAGDSAWPSEFASKLKALEAEAEQGLPGLVRSMKVCGLLPLFRPSITPLLRDARRPLSPWDRLAIRLAVAHLLSWETWSRRAATAHNRLLSQLTRIWASIPDNAGDVIDRLRAYEQQRRSLHGMDAVPPFRINQRVLRGWREIREQWRRLPQPSEPELLDILHQSLPRYRGRPSDPHLIRWLAKPEQHDLWQGELDVPSLMANLNSSEAAVARSRPQAVLTWADAVRHPRAVQWEPPGGMNLRRYDLARDGNGTLVLDLPLLSETNDGLEEVPVSFALAPSRQLQNVAIRRDGRQMSLSYVSQRGEAFHGVCESAELIFDRDHLHKAGPTALDGGEIGPIRLKLPLDIVPKAVPGAETGFPKAARHFQTAHGRRTGHEDALKAGFRVLSVDLGFYTLATCSVFELREHPAADGLCFPIDGKERKLWACHERSFQLRLPGEQPSRRVQIWRQQQRASLERLQRFLLAGRRLRALAALETVSRPLPLARLLADGGDDLPARETVLALRRLTEVPMATWTAAVRTAFSAFLRTMGEEVKAWRMSARRVPPHAAHGKSMWSLAYLSDVRSFLIGWSLLGRDREVVADLRRNQRGRYASKLMDHITSLKDDRRKNGANLIVQAARGLHRDGAGKWFQKHAPCHLIVFENEDRFRLRSDRPLRENSDLMAWALRVIPPEVSMQGEIYGLWTSDVAAAFSSRMSARTGTPGLRCKRVNTTDLHGSSGDSSGVSPEVSKWPLQPGDLVPSPEGDMFAYVNGSGTLTVTHSDINVAQNLQRRFWTRHGEIFRLSVSRLLLHGEPVWVPRIKGRRLEGALGGSCVLRPIHGLNGACRLERISPDVLQGLQASLAPVAAAQEEDEEPGNDSRTFFRDPSGYVLPADIWYPAADFWSFVSKKTLTVLRRELDRRTKRNTLVETPL